ncbi:DUF5302 domain-containing protein [Actinospica sp.]|jgi:hypothetical protein|uniref:DUF5302 domain-containing protein n=1 Tax=Actinospica sp. TaxID=1872142 RepID=UPI002CF2A55A|nr:DUF5302 domain-containing protein [Actinospica sp.]HWG23483.1 DUF5302 domain-containing protein [Actinospica sp.]
MSEAEHDQAEPADSAETEQDEVKRKFREALERKQALRHRTETAAGTSGKAHGAHGQAGGKRSFRRKSG